MIDGNESASNIAYYLYLQSAYKQHSPIPTRTQLKERNPHYKEMREFEKQQKQLGYDKYKLPEHIQ